MIETLQRTGHLDPAALLGLPEQWQMLHLAHTRSLFIGRYDPVAPTERKPTGPPPSPSAIERWRQRDRSGDVEQARRLLARPGLPEHVRRAAQATLTQAGET